MSTGVLVGAVCGVALLGVAIGALIGRAVGSKIQVLAHLATGAFLALTLFDIIPEAHSILSWPIVLFCGAMGCGVLTLISRNLFEVCPACGIAHLPELTPGRPSISFALVAMAVGTHCFLDGIGVVAGAHLGGPAGNGLALGVLLHKLPEGAALAVLLIGMGFSRGNAAWRAFLIQSLTLAGALFGASFLTTNSKLAVAIACAFLGGAFIYMVWCGLQPFVRTSRWSSALTTQMAAFCVTAALLVASNST